MLIQGTVFRVNSGNYFVEAGRAEPVVCKLRGNLKKELIYSQSGSRPQRVEATRKRRETDPIAVGDTVVVDPELGVIEEILPRRSEFARNSLLRGQHTLVANLDRLYIVFAAREPQPDLWLLDRFLVAAEAASLSPSILINKIDLVDDLAETTDLLRPYERAGYEVRSISAREGTGVDDLRRALVDRISAFTGPSGVGKSKLLNALCPGINLRVGDIGFITYKGRHTTTSAELIPLPAGGWVADTPGLRQLEFWQVDKEDIHLYFPEFRPFDGECRFRDCRHHDELGCAVRAAAERGDIDPRRYESFCQMSRR